MKRKNPNRKTNAVQDVAPQIPTDIAEMQSRENIMRTLATARSEVPTPKTQIKKKIYILPQTLYQRTIVLSKKRIFFLKIAIEVAIAEAIAEEFVFASFLFDF